MESIVVACITGVVTLVGVILFNSKSGAAMEVRYARQLAGWSGQGPPDGKRPSRLLLGRP